MELQEQYLQEWNRFREASTILARHFRGLDPVDRLLGEKYSD